METPRLTILCSNWQAFSVSNFSCFKAKALPLIFKKLQKSCFLKYSFQNSWSVEDQEYVALICDWQGVAFDLVSSDIIWTLYGYMKNLPDKNATVDSFMDYSIAFYHKELLRLLELMHVSVLLLVMPKLHFKWQVSVPHDYD